MFLTILFTFIIIFIYVNFTLFTNIIDDYKEQKQFRLISDEMHASIDNYTFNDKPIYFDIYDAAFLVQPQLHPYLQ